MAQIIVYRQYHLFMFPYRWQLFLNGKKAEIVRNNSLTILNVPPGHYKLEVRCNNLPYGIIAGYIFSNTIELNVAEQDTVHLDVRPHPLFNSLRKPKLIGNTESLSLLLMDESFNVNLARLENERQTITDYAASLRIHPITFFLTIASALFFLLSGIYYQDSFEENGNWAFRLGFVNLIGLLHSHLNKMLLYRGFEWKQQLIVASAAVLAIVCLNDDPQLFYLKLMYAMFGLLHLGWGLHLRGQYKMGAHVMSTK